jgi:hypothetical protein
VEETALTAFPKSLVALGTNITGEFALSRITAVSALKFILFVIHFFSFPEKFRLKNTKCILDCQWGAGQGNRRFLWWAVLDSNQ